MTLFFVPGMTVPRSGKDPRHFTIQVHVSGGDSLNEELRDMFIVGQHTYCEYLSKDTDNRVVKPYFDRDLYFDAQPAPEQVQAARDEVVRNLNRIAEAIRSLVPNSACLTYKIATRHGWTPDGRYKLSFRPFISGVRIKYTDIPLLLNHKSIDQLKDGFWDTSVYKESEQLLATIYGRKNAKDARVLLPDIHDSTTVIEDYIVQVAPSHWPLINSYALQANQSAAHSPPPAAKTANKGGVKKDASARAHDDEAGPSSGFDKIDDMAEVQHLTLPLANDAGLHEFFDNRDFNGLRFQYAHKTPDGQVVSLYIQHAAHQMCPVAGRVHKSNNATIIVNLKKRRVTFRCFDEDCQQNNGGGLVDITAHLSPDTMDALFGGTRETNDAALKHHQTTPLIEALTDVIRKSKAFAGVPADSKLVLSPPQTIHSPDGGVTRLSVFFRYGDKVGTLTQNTSVYDGSGNFVGMLVQDHLVAGPLSYIEPALPADASFAFNQISAKDGQLKSLEPHAGYSLTLYNMFDANKNTVALQVPRKAAKNITQKAKVKELMQAVQEASSAHVGRVLGDQFMPVVFNVQQNNITNNGTINNNNNNHITIAAPAPDDNYSVMISRLDAVSQDSGFRKLDGFIYEPMPGAPCAYVKKWMYKDYINNVLEDEPAYRSSPWRHREAMEYLEKFDNKFLPVLKPDRDLLSFANGVLDITSGNFLDHDDPALQGRVARHHISQEYTGTAETPLLDIVLDAQFDREVADILCGMMGRLMFRIGQLDKWQVLPYLVGVGGTGKSLILTIVESFFNEEAVGEIASQSEEVFGLDNLVDKEVVIGRDMPEKLSKALKQEHMQSMTSGERLSVAVKGKKAKHVRWTAPVIMASNHEPDYKNSGGQVSRRMVTFRFEQAVSNPREDLLSDILDQELPAVIARCLACYHRLRERVKEAGGFWAAMPVTIHNWQNRLSAATNKLHEFLEMDDDDRGCKIEHVPGKVTWVSDFKEAYEACMDGAKLDPYKQPHIFQKFGFKINTDAKVRENVCKWCKQVARGRGESCCSNYSHGDRVPKAVIYDMMLQSS